MPTQILTDFSNRSTCWGFESRLLCRLTFVSNVNKLVDILTYRIPYLLLKTSKLLSLYTFKRKTSQGMVKKVCRYNGQLVQVQWTFGQNHEIILSTVLAFDCIYIASFCHYIDWPARYFILSRRSLILFN